MTNNLSEGSKSYHSQADIYEIFSQAEDKPGMIAATLLPYVSGKDVLNLGCGTGKYLSIFAHPAKRYFGLDISADQLRIAKAKSLALGLSNVSFICSSAESIDLPDNSIDTVISTWVIGTIVGWDRRAKAINEAERLVRPGGRICLIENDLGGEFERLRGRYPDIARTKEYNDWLEGEMGFGTLERFETYFEFASLDEARQVFGSIWGPSVGADVTDRIIPHRIICYSKTFHK